MIIHDNLKDLLRLLWNNQHAPVFILFIYLASLWKKNKRTQYKCNNPYIHETEQEAGTPQQFTPITVGPLVKISDKLQTKN
jgi:hypothetical protein